nr:LysR substrate-binding domain-containing protein [Aureimonas jatrophae]
MARRTPSLSGVRAAILAFRHASLTRAAAELGVSASAVSHQVRKLEVELGVALFERHANALRPTDEGRSFLEQAATALAMLEAAAEGLHRDANEVRVQASSSLAVRWLIPSLGRLAARHPRLRVKVETIAGVEPSSESGQWDVSIRYRRQGETGAGERLMPDLVLPMVAPRLPALAIYQSRSDIAAIPALRCTPDDWDWTLWCRSQRIDVDMVRIGHAFDTDDAAIRGAVAGVGMVLASSLLTQAELQGGALVALAGFEPVELGCYEIEMRDGERSAVRKFRQWLTDEAEGRQRASSL